MIILVLIKFLVLTSAQDISTAPAGQAAQPVPVPPPSDGKAIFMPYPPQQQFCPNQKPGFLGDKCDDNNPCYNDYSLECRNNNCSCRQGNIPSSENNGLCESAPSLNQPCVKECQAPLVCRDDKTGAGNAPAPAPVTSDATAGNAMIRPMPPIMPPPPPQGRICRCDPPYKLVNGYTCTLECKSDELYDEKDGKCKKRCAADEVKLDNGDCAKIAKIGQPCKNDQQCTQQYARCAKDICGCQSGFDEDSGQCKPRKYSCPWQNPIRDSSNNVVKCNKTAPTFPDNQQKDTCGNDAYCLTSEIYYYPDNTAEGFCCPKPNISCPLGDPDTNATCGPIVYPLAADTKTPQKQCPYETHYCYTVNVGNGFSENLCCPKACRDSYILVGGTCYPQVQYGDACMVNQQCSQFSGECRNGTCKCPPNAQTQDNGGANRYCIITCNPDEILINNQCQKRLNLGDSCDNKPSNLCPANAGCDENKKCSCLCNYIQLGKNRCEPYPVCRKNYYPYPMPLMETAADGKGANASPKPIQPPTNATNDGQSADDAAKSNGNYTFCRLYQDDVPPVPAVQKCPQGQYCNSYVYDLGLCCKIPDPICPNGENGKKTCNPGDPNACDNGSYCYQYYQAAGGNRPGYTCCSNF